MPTGRHGSRNAIASCGNWGTYSWVKIQIHGSKLWKPKGFGVRPSTTTAGFWREKVLLNPGCCRKWIYTTDPYCIHREVFTGSMDAFYFRPGLPPRSVRIMNEL